MAPPCDMLTGLADLFADTMTAQPGAMSGFGGDWVASGTALNLDCHIEGQSRLVRDSSGHEVVSSLVVYVAGYNDLTVEQHRYTVPARYSPNAELKAVSVQKFTDEGGTCYEVVLLP